MRRIPNPPRPAVVPLEAVCRGHNTTILGVFCTGEKPDSNDTAELRVGHAVEPERSAIELWLGNALTSERIETLWTLYDGGRFRLFEPVVTYAGMAVAVRKNPSNENSIEWGGRKWWALATPLSFEHRWVIGRESGGYIGVHRRVVGGHYTETLDQVAAPDKKSCLEILRTIASRC